MISQHFTRGLLTSTVRPLTLPVLAVWLGLAVGRAAAFGAWAAAAPGTEAAAPAAGLLLLAPLEQPASAASVASAAMIMMGRGACLEIPFSMPLGRRRARSRLRA